MLRRGLPMVLAGLSLAAAGTLQDFSDRCLRAQGGGGRVRILHFGDSHLAAPAAHRAFARAFRDRFGDGGVGLALPSWASHGWRRSRGEEDGGLGLGGGFLETNRDGEWARLEGRFSRLRVHFLRRPGGGKATVRVDGVSLGEVDLASERPSLALFERDLTPASAPRRLEIQTRGVGLVRLLGVALESPSGAVYSPLAFNGAQASWMARVPEELFVAQVRAEAPDLVVLAFGTNEANVPALDGDAYRRGLDALLERFRRAAPNAALVLVGPPDGKLPRGLPGALERVASAQRAAAERAGGCFLDQRRAMGGAGSIGAWANRGLASRDLVHLTGPGYERLGGEVLSDLFLRMGRQEAPRWAARPKAPPPPPEPEAHPIYRFRTVDGRLIITDNPALVAGLAGSWEGRVP